MSIPFVCNIVARNPSLDMDKSLWVRVRVMDSDFLPSPALLLPGFGRLSSFSEKIDTLLLLFSLFAMMVN